MIEVLGHRVLVKPDPVEEVSKGGIVVVTDSNRRLEQNAQFWGTVVQVGPTAYGDSGLGGVPWVSVGDRVAYVRHGGKFVKDPDSGEEFVVLNDEDVLIRNKV